MGLQLKVRRVRLYYFHRGQHADQGEGPVHAGARLAHAVHDPDIGAPIDDYRFARLRQGGQDVGKECLKASEKGIIDVSTPDDSKRGIGWSQTHAGQRL